MRKIKISKQKKSFNNLEKKVIVGFFLFHFLASQFFLPYFGKKEVFPIFTWSLFSSCNEIDNSMPEIEILLDEGNIITSKQFSRKLVYQSFFYMKQIFETQDQKLADQLFSELLYLISHSINESVFKYKIFKSEIRRVEYVKSNSLTRGNLFKEGLFKRDLKN